MRMTTYFFIVGLLLAVRLIAQQPQQKERVFVTDTTSFLVPSDIFNDKGWYNFSDPYLVDGQLFAVKERVDTIAFPDDPIELMEHIWNTDFYRNILKRKPQRGFFKHFENTEIYLKENDTIYRILGGAYEY